jgi:AcrR family transcriptional regulator
MGIAERKERERAERELRITGAARRIAAEEGWSAVTMRRLAGEIEYSQPVLYSHFRNREAIVTAVAIEGFGALAGLLRAASEPAHSPADAVHLVATAYMDFAFDEAALYEAMFVLPTGLHFAQPDAPRELGAAFHALATVVSPFCAQVDVATEAFWAALHGAAQLERHGRIRPAFRVQRVAMIVQALLRQRDDDQRAT